MPILVATEREVVVIDVERGASASVQRMGSSIAPHAWQRIHWFRGARGVAPTGPACSEATMAERPGERSAS